MKLLKTMDEFYIIDPVKTGVDKSTFSAECFCFLYGKNDGDFKLKKNVVG